MRGYCPHCGQHIEALCDESPGLSQQEIALLELSKRLFKLEQIVRSINEKKKIQPN